MTAAALLWDPETGSKKGLLIKFPLQLQMLWGGWYIDGLELAAVSTSVEEWKDVIAARDVLWFIDSSPAMAALVRGGSSCERLDKAAITTHLFACACKTRLWFEWVESKSNWSDEASRSLDGGPWAMSRGFTFREVSCHVWPWREDIAVGPWQ